MKTKRNILKAAVVLITLILLGGSVGANIGENKEINSVDNGDLEINIYWDPPWGFVIELKNTGNVTVTDVDWSIEYHGAWILFGRWARTIEGQNSIPPGEMVTVHSKMMIFGFGMIMVIISVEDAEYSHDGFLMGWFWLPR